MKPTKGYDQAQTMDGSGFVTLPAGGYVCEIKDAREDVTQRGAQKLVLFIDIAEGEYKNFFGDQYKDMKKRDPNTRWRGLFHQMTETADGMTNSYFKGLMTAIERSNPGYIWDWNEGMLRGKKVGFIFREEEYINQKGELKTVVKPAWPRDIATIREGVEVPEVKRLDKAASGGYAPLSQSSFTQVEDDELPF